jgi:hypothetical protein
MIESLWEALADTYILRPKEGFVQTLHGQVIVIPSRVLSDREVEVYLDGKWLTVNNLRDLYVYIIANYDHPIPEQESGWEYVTFIIMDETLHMVNDAEIEITDSGQIVVTTSDEPPQTVTVTIYGLVRCRTGKGQL